MRIPITALRLIVTGWALLSSSMALAQATRTWVSGVGDDTNPCSRTAPCKTFAGAITKTAAGGEVDIIDPGDYGGLTITKAMTISGWGNLAAIRGTSIVVNAQPTDVVILRDLALQGFGSTGSGIQFLQGQALHIERCTIVGFQGDGIQFTPSGGGQLFLTEVRASENRDAGLRVQSGSPSAPSRAMVARSSFSRNAIGLLALEASRVTGYDLRFGGNVDTGVALLPQGGGAAEVNLEQATFSGDAIGIRAEGGTGSAVARLSNVVALDEVTAATQADANGSIRSFGNNRIVGAIAGDPCAAVTCPATDCLQAGVCNPETGTCDPATGTCPAQPSPKNSSCQTQGGSTVAGLLVTAGALCLLSRRRRTPESQAAAR